MKSDIQDGIEERFHLVVEGAPVAMVMVSAAGLITLVNAETEKLFGYVRQELLGQPVEMLVPERFRGGHAVLRGGYHKDPTLRAMGAGRELYGLRKDGTEVPVEIGLNPITTAEGHFVLASIIDISERGRFERERQASEQRYTDLVEQAIVGVIVRRPDRSIALVNEAYCHITGYTRDELMRLKVDDLVKDTDPGVLARVEALRPGTSFRQEVQLRRKDGTHVPVEALTHRLLNGNIQSMVQDIGERKHAEQARAVSERRYAELVDQAHEGITVRKPTGEFVFVNAAFCRMLGYGHSELLLMNIRDVVHPEDQDTVAQVQALRTGQGIRLEKRMLRKDGRTIYVEVSAHRLNDGDFRSAFQDITERKEAELRVQIYAEELRQMSQRLLEAQETERRGIARELHDEVGQSLTAAYINLSDLERQAAAGPLSRQITEVCGIITQLLKQVRQLSLDLHPSVLDDLGIAAAMRWLMRERAAKSGLQVSLDVPEDLPRFNSLIENTLFRVLQEALSNVMRHAEAANLTVELRFEAATLELTIRDDGRGFDPAAAHKHALNGNSLGVLGMQERVRLAGGTISIKSDLGQGTEIRLSLPVGER